MNPFVISFQETNRSMTALTGGKGANLGELSHIDGIAVPDGFCVTTEAYKRITGNNAELSQLLDELSHPKANISSISARIRAIIENTPIPEDIIQSIRLNEQQPYAVRSSATAEDLPYASFAGQQDTFLNVIGKTAVLQHISQCWASLFTERAVTYRNQHHFDHRKVQLAVVVQQMVFPQAAGILFTADPVSGNRKIVSIDAGFGLGEALVSGRVNPDNYKVRNRQIIEKTISAKQLAMYGLPGGGVKEQAIEPALQNLQTLRDEQILQLAGIGRKIETHFGSPQDIEWCLEDDTFYIVQSRPITTLFPIPATNDDAYHVYLSVGHQQMMTDPIKPLGLSIWQLTAARPLATAGGRLFVDVAPALASPATQQTILNTAGQSDPLIKDALLTIIDRGDFIKSPTEQAAPVISTTGFRLKINNDPALAATLIHRDQTSIATLKENIQTKSGAALFDFILADIRELKAWLTASLPPILAMMDASAWINEQMKEWLNEKNVADTISQSVSNNVTSEMGLALLDVADIIRPYPAVIGFLQQATADRSLDDMLPLDGGPASRNAILAFLDRYGMRCAGEIDITRTRWNEQPLTLAPLILSNIKTQQHGASRQKFQQGLQEALQKEATLIDQLLQLPDGAAKAAETKEMISLVRNFAGFREYPKYSIVSRYFIYKQALLKEAEALIQAGVIREKEDMYYLSFEELHHITSTHQLDDHIIPQRKDAYLAFGKLTPPRVFTSDGEVVTGRYKREDLPAGAIAGLAVSSGIIEGRARVILRLEDANLEDGDILVTAFTDPSWTPLFVAIKGLVTEVGGLMTHGAVIAREYGLPAVVGVPNATRLIKDGQRIRVNGTDGFVEIL